MIGQKLIVCGCLIGGWSSNAALPGITAGNANNIIFGVCKDNLIQDVLIRFLFEHCYVELNCDFSYAGSMPVRQGKKLKLFTPRTKIVQYLRGKNKGT